MDKKEDFKQYPKILTIEKDGKIIGLDKRGRANSDFNTNTIDYSEFARVYNAEFNQLHDLYKRDKRLSRYDKNKNDYDTNKPISPIDDKGRFYNDFDERHGFAPQSTTNRSRKKAKWLVPILVVAIIVMSFFMIKSHYENKNDEEQKQQEVKANNLENEINDTKQQLAQAEQTQQDSQSKINNLQNKVNNLKQSSNNGETENMQEAINQLQKAQNEKLNGNLDGVNNAIGKVNDSINTDDNRERARNFGDDVKNKTQTLSENEYVNGAKEKVSNAWHDITNVFFTSEESDER
ncbi:hypothetical protein [Staphylococcus shinii]|uniref:hypothetical protein n=1 Tax=Staphylococcus shinii TaxID=2912228 RepID=UPI003F5431A7